MRTPNYEWVDYVNCQSCDAQVIYCYSEENEVEDYDYEGNIIRWYEIICPVCGERIRTSS